MSRRIAVVGLGGTIAMGQGPQGLRPTHSMADTMSAVALPDDVVIEVVDHAATASANITFESLRLLTSRLRDDILPTADGVVLVQGTDTIEETAFALELLLGADKPIVMTGAMRSPAQPGADGPANLATAIRAAAFGPGDAGVMVAMNDEIHAARYVRKAHTTALSAFSSGDFGALGRIHEGRILLVRERLPRLEQLWPACSGPWPKVALAPIGLDQDSAFLEALPSLGMAGCVLQAMGAGHIPEPLVGPVAALVDQMPVILCSRAAAGSICERTYGYPGSETDLLRRGVLAGGALSSHKARILLTLSLAASGDRGAETFVRNANLI